MDDKLIKGSRRVMNGWLLGVPNKYVVLRRRQQAGRIKSQRTLDGDWPPSLGTFTVLSLTPGLGSSPNVHPRKAGRLLAFLTSGPRALMLPQCVRRPTVIVHWHLGNWKCFFWVWVTPYAEEGAPCLSATLSFSLWTRPWHVVCGPMLGGGALIRLGNVTALWK